MNQLNAYDCATITGGSANNLGAGIAAAGTFSASVRAGASLGARVGAIGGVKGAAIGAVVGAAAATFVYAANRN